jgi:hypothetical protein
MAEYQLPDGKVLSIPDDTTLEGYQKIQTHLSGLYPEHYQPYKEEADLSYSDKAIYGLKGAAQAPAGFARGIFNTLSLGAIGLLESVDYRDDSNLTAAAKNIKGYINADPSADSAAANISQAKLLSKINPALGGISVIADYLKGKAGINESLLAPNEEYRDSYFNKIPEGLGSAAAFIGTTYANPFLGGALAVGTGIGTQAEMQDAARARGEEISLSQEIKSKILGGVIGFSEIINPLSILKIFRGVRKGDPRAAPYIQHIKNSVKSAGIEGVQETLAGLAQELTAQGIYDPTIEVGESMADDFTVGAIVGAIVGGGSSAAHHQIQKNQALEYETNQAKNYDEEQKASDEIIRQKIILAAEQGDQVIDPALVPDAPIDLINNVENELNNINNELDRLNSDENFDAYDLITNEEEKRNKVIEDKEKAKELKIRKEASESALKFITKGAGKNVVWTEQQIEELIAAEIEFAKSIPGKIVFDKLNTKEKELILQQAKINRERLFKAQNIADNYNPYNQLDDKVKPEGVEIPVLETFNFVPNADGTINVVGQETKQTIGTFSNIEEASQAATEKTKQNRNEFIVGFSEQVTSINGLAGNGTASNIGRKLYDPLNNLIDAKVLANFDVRVSDKRQAQAQKEKLIEENEQAGQSKLASELMDNMDTTGLSIEELSQIKQDLEIQLSKQQAVYPISGNKIDPESTLALFWESAEKSGIGAKNFYTVKEAKKLLNKSDFNQFMSEKSNIKFEKIKSTGEMKPVKRIKDKIDVSQKAFDNAFESKNIEVSYTSPAFKYLAETFTGDTNLSNMSIGQKEMLMARIKNLPRFNNKTKLPNFTPRPYTAEQIDAFYNQYQGNRFSNNDIKLAIKNNTNGKDLTPKQINEFKTDLIESGRATKDNNKLSMTNDFKIQQARKAESYSNETTDEFKSRLVRTTLLTPEQIEEVVNDDAIYKEGVIDSSDVLALPSPEPMQKYSELFKLMRKRLIDRNLGDVALKFDRELKASLNIKQKGNKYFYEPVDLDKSKGKPTAVYDRPLNKIILSIEAINPDGTMSEAELGEELRNKLDHESVHALIQLGILTQKEVDMLFKDAKKLLPKDFQKKLINAYTGKPINEINDAYLKKDFSEDLKEELVAEFIRISGNNPSQLISPKSKTIINKIINFLTTLGQTIYDAGFTSSRTIIRDIESGKIGARERGVLRNTQRVRSRNEQKYGIARPSAEQLDTSLISKYKDVPNFSRLEMINEQPLFSRAPTLNTTSLLDFIKQNPEGFTVDPITLKSPSSGFAVAPVKALEIVVDKNKINDDVIESYTDILKSLSGKMNRDVYAGGWLNSKNNRYYLDASVIFDTLEEALYVAEAAQQKAVYDLGTFNETRTKQGIQELKKTGRFNNQTRNEQRANIQELSKLFRETRNRSSQNQIDTPLFSRENPEEIYNEWRSKTYNPKTLEQTEEELKEYVDSLPPSIMPRWNKDAHPVSLRVAFDFQEGIDPVIMTDAPSYSRSDKEIPNKYKEIDEAINGTNNTPDETFADAIIDIAETKEEVGSFLSRMRAEIIDEFSIPEKTVLKLGKASAKIRELNSRAISGAIQALRMSKKGKGVHSQMMMRGVPVLVDEQGNPVPKGSKNFGGTKVIDFKHGGFVKIIGQLHTTEYGEDLMRLFKMYRIGLRGTRLNKEGKEVVLTPEQLELATEIGKDFPIIQIVSDQYSEYNNAILDYAVQTGILSEEITINQLIENISSNQKVKITKNDLTNLAKEARKNELTDEQFRQELLILSSDLNIKLEADNKIETRGTAEIWKDNADYYPFYRKMADDSIQGPAVAGGFLSGNPLNIEIKGSKKAIEPEPLEVMARNMQSIVTAAMKNEGLSRLMEVYEEGKIAKKILLKDKKSARDLGSDVISVFENGEQIHYQVADPIFTMGLQAFGMTQDAGLFMKVIGLPSNILRESITRDPGFIIKNMLRDTLSSAVTSGANFIPIVDTFKGFAADLSELERFGVIGGYDAANDRQDVVKKIKKIKREQGLDVYDEEGNFAIDQVVKLWDFMGGLTTRSDGSTRKAVADSILELTGDQVEAAYQALEIINFDRRGFNPYMRIVTTAIPFLNARIQGLDVLYRSGTGQYSSKISEIAKNTTPDEVAKSIILTTVFRGGMLTLATLLYYALIGDEERYEGERQSVRDDNWLIPTPDGLPPLKFPIPFEVGFIFKTVPERILDYSMTKFNNPNYGNTTGKQLEDSISRGITTTLKLDPTAWQIFKPLKEVRNNKSGFTGNPIVPPFMEEGIEPEQQYTTNTSSFAIALGDQFNVSPIKIDYLMNQYTGTIGTYLLNIAETKLSFTSK